MAEPRVIDVDALRQDETEVWLPVREAIGLYDVSSYGRVRSLDRAIIRRDGKPLKCSGKLLKARANAVGYPVVAIYTTCRILTRTVHSLVASSFLLPPDGPIGTFKGEFVVNHKDGIKTNNHFKNLEYVTTGENNAHAIRIGIHRVVGASNPRAKITDDDVREIRRLYRGGARQVDLADAFGIDQTGISRIVIGKGWSHVV